MSRETTYTGTEVGILAVLTPFMVVLIFVTALPFGLWNAYVAMWLWNWFPAVYFHLQPISFWMVFGISMAFGSFKSARYVKGEETNWKGALIGLTFGPLLALGIGYLVHLKIS